MRLSSIQKDILFVLFAVEQKGNVSPIPNMQLLAMINKSRSQELFDTNFRVSAHKLNEHGLIDKYRSTSLKLAWGLTDIGRVKASDIYNKSINEDISTGAV